uniref:RING-type E3 ubiquitin transferase n=1 Tax=Eptatretus burgeri TaxID=7764 RepID=A0A8C4RA97_EPTBU
MAEALALQQRYYCHRCTREVLPELPEYTCPTCQSGFIEQLPATQSEFIRQTRSGGANLLDEVLQTVFPHGLRSGHRASTPVATFPSTSEELRHSWSWEQDGEDGIAEIQGSEVRSSTDSDNSVASETWNSTSPSVDFEADLDSVVNELLGLMGGHDVFQHFVPWEFLHSDPRNYVWSSNGIDRIITQMLGQMENTGPPPANDSRIAELPPICITKEHVDSHLECSICKEDFVCNEVVKQLPCLHLYHSSCIVTWLKLHDTCPVCRTSLDGESTDRQETQQSRNPSLD